MKLTRIFLTMLALFLTLILTATAITLDTAEYADGNNAVLSADSRVYISAVSGTTYTLPEGASVNVGTTGATVSGNTLTATGYAGTVTVTNGNDVTEVVLCGATKFKPGLNILTGSDASFDPSSYPVDAYNLTFTTTGSTYVTSVDTYNNALAYVFTNNSGSGGKYPIVYTKNSLSPTLELDRPFKITYDYACPVPHYIMTQHYAQTTFALNVSATRQIASSNSWKSYSFYDAAKNVSITNAIPKFGFMPHSIGNNASFYFKNLSIVPAYKITYKDATRTTLATRYELPENGVYTVDNSLAPSGYDAFATGVNMPAVSTVTLANEDITLYAVKADAVFYTDGKTTASSSDKTVTTPDTLGFEAKDFICWLDENDNRYFPGDDAPENNTKLSAFYQDATKPAMGFAFEGSVNHANNVNVQAVQFLAGLSAENGKTSTDAYGRTVFKLSGTKAAGAVRLNFACKSPYLDPLEYYIVSTRQNNIDLNDANALYTLYYYVSGVGYSHESKTHKVADVTSSEGEFEKVWNMKTEPALADMTLYRFGDSTVNPWKVSQFWYDPIIMSGSHYVETDIINFRVYRGGVTTVNYYDGDTLLFSETDRGVGTGYLLNSDVPSKEGCVFLGWADEDGNLYQNGKLDLTGDTNVYAKFVNKIVTDTENFDIKVSKVGIRFRGSVDYKTKRQAKEYGFIVSTAAALDGNHLTFDLPEGRYVKGTAYIKDELDIVNEETEDSAIFTGVCYNIPAGKYHVDLYARTYIKFENATGEEITAYGDIAVQNIRAQALKFKEAYDRDPTSSTAEIYLLYQDMFDALIANTPN